MKKRILFIIAVSLFSNIALAYDDTNYGGELEQYKKEIQDMVARVEMLEHNLSKLERQCGTKIADSNIATQVVATIPVSAGAAEIDNLDIFDVQHKNIRNDSQDNVLLPKNTNIVSDEKKQYDLALALLKEGKIAESEEKFMGFLNDYPKSSLVGNAYFWYAETFFKRNIFDKATINYLKGYKQSPKGAKAADSLLKLSIALGELGKKKEACGVLAKLDSEFTDRSASSIKRTKDTRIKFGCN